VRAGRLISLLRVMRRSTTENTYGEPIESLNEVYRIRCEIVVLRGAQLEAAQKINERITYKIRARYTDQLENGDFLEDNAGIQYEVLADTSDPNRRPRELELMCRKVQ